MSVSDGTLLDGRVRYAQPVAGYRTGLEPVLLAASVPARPGDRVVEAGTGAGAGLLCLASRVAEIAGLGLEIDPEQAGIARRNIAANGFAGLCVQEADVAAWRAEMPFDHAFANPPWHDPAGTPSPEPGRLAAKRAETGLLAAWAASLARALRPRGTLSLIVPAASLAEAVSALTAAECAEIRVLPFWPKAGRPAKLVVLQGVRLGRGPCVMGAGLTLHEADGAFTAAADSVLRGGQALAI